ncbi:MAG: hypothetical protein KF774_11010 [Planctomyces sp.]|nr:hypothetical protein [Planctomyces sp.]
MLRKSVWQAAAALVACAAALGPAPGIAADQAPSSLPETVPLTRDDMKRALDDSKEAAPRLPLPPLTDAERQLIDEQHAEAERTGELPRRFGLGNNGRMRAYYLPEYGFQLSLDVERARSGTNRNSASGFDPNFRTMLFWIVSRGNNCTYCLGHQESSLASRGVTDDELAALDGDWSEFDDAHSAAFAFATKLSFQPWAISDQDVEELREHFDETQTSEIIQAIAGFNATNRWTGPLRIKQDVLFPFVRPTSASYASAVSRIAPLEATPGSGGRVPPASRTRPALESQEDVDSALDAARSRSPRLALADDSAVQSALDDAAAPDVIPNWMRLLAATPSGKERIKAYSAVLDKGPLDARTRAIIAYVGARHDRAWYALGHAMNRLREMGFSDDAIFALDRPESLESEADREIVRFARTITVDPALVTDDDFARLRARYSDKQVAEILYHITQAAFFNRLTEAAGLPLEP